MTRTAGIVLRIGFVCLVGALMAFGILLALARSWTADRVAELAAGGEGLETESGLQQVATRGGGARVLVIHGEGGGYDQGLALAAMLGLDEAEIISPSRPGYLGTSLLVGDTFEEQARALEDVLETLETAPVPVVAYGSGVPVALWLAAASPQMVERLVLVSGFYGPPAAQPGLLTRWGRKPLEDGLTGRFFELDPRAVTRAIVEENQTVAAGGGAALASAILENEASREALSDFLMTSLPMAPRVVGLSNDIRQLSGLAVLPPSSPGCPVLLVQGALDRLSPAEAARAAAAKFPQAEVVVVADAGHWPWLAPGWEALQKVVAGFLGLTREAPTEAPPAG